MFRIVLDLSTFTGLSTTQSLIYPLKVDLRSGFTSLAAIRTPVIFLVRKPLAPLNLAWTFVLSAPVDFGPDGVFQSTALESAIAPGGRLADEIHALAALAAGPRAVPVDVAVSPMLLVQLARMRDGYSVIDGGETREVPAGRGGAAAAAQTLAELKQIAASNAVELSVLPFSEPSLPALAAGGLSRDLGTQLERGRQTVFGLLGRAPDGSVLRPPGSALDQESLAELPAQAIGLLLLDPEAAPPPPQILGFAPPATTLLSAEGGSMVAVVSDPDVAALMSSSVVTDDPALGAQAVLGELAAIWLQEPSVDRGLAIAVPESPSAPGAFFGPLVRGIAGSPWLKPTTATSLAAAFPPATQGQLAPVPETTFPRSYVEELKQARHRIDTYRSMLVGESTKPDQLETQLLIAEAGRFVNDLASGQAFIAAVRDTVGAAFAGVRPDTGQVITLTSSSGKGIPVQITNANREPLRVMVRLVSPHLQTTPQSTVVLPAGVTETVSFDVRLNTTGRFPVDVQIVSPSGRVINQATLIVRSTALNRIALVITIGAALLAILVWARRFLPRRTP